MIAFLLNHLWQSTLFAGAAGLLALALKGNGAHIRFWLWFAASVKFLVPFAALTALSAHVLTPMVPPVSAPAVTLIAPLAKPFSAPAMVQAATRWTAAAALRLEPPVGPAPRAAALARPASPAALHIDLETALLTLWAAGFLLLATRWLLRWSRVRALLRDAQDVPVDAPIAVKFSASRLEPGLVGILSPIILLPRDIERQLSPAELKAVLAHELCHWRRHDNLLAAIHMLVEALFWFFPLVWWLGARLNAERERACDESVLADGNDPQLYAEGILKVCRAYLQSPLTCVAGISGSGLKTRIATIMENRLIPQLNAARKFVLSASAAMALALPLALGLLAAPAVQVQAKAILASIKPFQQETDQAPSATPFPTNAAATGAGGAPARLLSRLLPKNLVIPSPDWPHLLSPVSPDMFASNEPPPPAADVSPAAVAASTAGAAQALAARTCELPKIAATAPLEQSPGSALMTVPVTINGATEKFLLDIGLKKPTEVSKELAAKLSLPEPARTYGGPPGADGSFNGMTGAGWAGVPVYEPRNDPRGLDLPHRVIVHSFGIGGATGQRLQFMTAQDGEIAQSAPYAGFLTGAFFRQYDVELDFAGKQINWLTPVSCTDPNQIVFWAHKDVAVIPVSLAPDGRLQMQATIQGHVINAELDTSSARTVMRRDIAERYVGLKADTTDMAPVSDLEDGRHMQVYVHTFPQLVFAGGGVTAENVPVLIQDYSMIPAVYRHTTVGNRADTERIPDLSIGMDVLSQLHMYVVLGQSRVYVTAAQPPSNAPPAMATALNDRPNAPQTAQTEAAKPTVDQLRLQQAAEARSFCTDRSAGPDTSDYGRCVNTFLGSRYGWHVVRGRDGSLTATADLGGIPLGLPPIGNNVPLSRPPK